MMYKGFEDMKARLGLQANLTWRIGSASRGNKLGVRRTSIKAAGLWMADVVDTYCQKEA